MRFRRNAKRSLTLLLAVWLLLGSICRSSMNVYAKEDETEGKEEVIYVTTSAQGEVDNIQVVNMFEKGAVVDYGDYSEVKMMNSTEVISKDNDRISFYADKDKTCYQGTLENAEIPWKIAITYYLDGKKITPEQLAGKSGKLQIKIVITENKKCKTDFYHGFALQAAVTLDTEKCSNIQADGATIANVGADKQISYTILPGKGLSRSIYASVKDFEMDAVTINGVKTNLEVEIDDTTIRSKAQDITDASRELSDGAADLKSGTGELLDGGKTLSEGAKSVAEGADSLSEGIRTLGEGITKMQDALDALDSKSASLTDGSKQMQDTLTTLDEQLGKMEIKTEEISELTESSAAIRQGIREISTAAASLADSVSYNSYKNIMSSKGLNLDELRAGNESAQENLAQQIEQLELAMAQIKEIPGYETNEDCMAQLEQLSRQEESLQQMSLILAGNNAALEGTESYLQAAGEGAYGLAAAAAKLNNNYKKFDIAVNSLADPVKDMAESMKQLQSAVHQITDKNQTLVSGTKDYTEAVSSIRSAYADIVEGCNVLQNGSDRLLDGAKNMETGTDSLYDGISAVDDGAAKLSDGTNEFYNQADGIDGQITDTIDSAVDELSGADFELVSFVSGKNTKIASVQFVIKTAAIEKPEQDVISNEPAEKSGFWSKFLKLFGF